MSGRVARKKDATIGRPSQLVGNPVPLILVGLLAGVDGELHRRLLDVEARVKEPIPIRSSSRAGTTRIAGRHVATVDPDLKVLTGSGGVDLEASGERRGGRLVALAAGQHPPPAERVDESFERRTPRSVWSAIVP